ncbi:hypothetical protein [Brevundimonas sp.]|uniref:hypothetical protein n=1 Tax=Brevundimonas sp. TaxID=1871086 RepID=UPI002B601691|nr:hypothetical protein [Brevundimonas sp.]HWQ86548.1 hypothetical protein [Brevundimonas sp.]
MTPARRQYAHQAYGRTADAFETVAWRPPVAHRFDPRPANDGYSSERGEPTLREMAEGLPAWFTIVAGGAVAALLGALLGGALQV